MTVRQGRQTGRTTKIAMFAATQLFEIGQVIVTDHTIFEFRTVREDTLRHLIQKIDQMYHSMIGSRIYSENNIRIRHSILSAGHRGHDEMKVVHLWVENLKSKEFEEEVEWVNIK